MYRYLVLIMLLPLAVSAQLKDEFLEPAPQHHLVLNTVVLHENDSTFQSGFRPINAVESLGSQGIGKLSLYTSYISTNNKDAGEHVQRIELYSPGKKKLVYKAGKKFNVKDASPSKGKFQRGYLEHTVIFPQLSHADPKNFGIYIISIYLDDRWMRDFLVPVFAW